MAIARQKGDLEELGEETSCEHPAPHNEQAVARVRDPRNITASGIDLCPFHLALWNDIHDGKIAREADVEHLVPDDIFLHLADLPATKDVADTDLERVGIDHTGRGHYLNVPDDGALIAIEVDTSLEVRTSRRLFEHVTVADYLETIHENRGWMLLGDDYSPEFTPEGRR